MFHVLFCQTLPYVLEIRKKCVYEYKLTNALLKSYKKNYIFIINMVM